ncbi:MAG: AMP-binding protein, partial [bacterium]|nr:AMP-binding protein [bacterium]
HIMDNGFNLQPVGLAGELCIGGEGLAEGYLNRPELTHEKFVNLYRTGDLARWLDDGNIQFIGRMDSQVKIRGFRVELGEIKAQLETWEKVREAVVVAGKDINSETYLCAYVVTDSTVTLDAGAMREYLSGKLPHYMVPSYLMELERIPLTATGKVNHNELPEPLLGTGNKYSAPVDDLEKQLVSIWSEILSVEEHLIGREDNFFALGGHSLKATTLVSKVHQTTHVQVPLATIFKTPTVKAMATYIKQAVKTRYVAIEAVEQRDYYPLSSAQKRLFVLQQMDLDSTVYNIPQMMVLDTEKGFEVNPPKLEETFRHLIRRHESFRTSFHMVADQPVQKMHKAVPFGITSYDLSTGGGCEIPGIIGSP